MRNIRSFKVVSAIGILGISALVSSSSFAASAATSPIKGPSNPCAHFPKAPINIAAFGPFSGPSASTGERGILPGLKVGTYEVNAGGGVCGNQFVQVVQDSRGDPADAIPAAYQLVATHHLNGIIGLDSETAVSTARIFNAAKILTMTTAGATQLNSLRMKYVYRTYPPDSVEAYAMVAAAFEKRWKRAVVFYDNTSGDQSAVPPLLYSYRHHGGKILANMTVTEDEPSYETYIQKIVKLKPQVIFFEADVQTAGTFFGELQQSSLGLKTPIIQGSTEPLMVQAIASATHLTNADISKFDFATQPQTKNAVTYASFAHWFQLANNGLSPYNGYNAANFDGINLMALAMYLAGSPDPTKYVKYIEQLTNDPKGHPCIDYASCLVLLKKHKTIFYDGAAGPHLFNKFHWSTGQWAVAIPGAQGNGVVIRQIPAAQLLKLSQ